ncbi:branched-chain amino acid ABC transporter binding protein [Streptococcus pneumoniae]|nr:branched-chain amino acid ABC transporter binding protein [Streptococcus pneumoniae]
MKKKFALSFVALASVALLAACGEVKSGAVNTESTLLVTQ